MYLPRHFEETRIEKLHGLIRDYPLGTLVLSGPDGMDANHLPFELDADAGDHGLLVAHVARANPLWHEACEGDEALVVFRAEDAYISPNWYPSKHEHHQAVPTWNYRAVHVRGPIRIRDDEQFVRGVVARLTRRQEAGTGSATPWKMTDSTPEFIDRMLAAIVGIEIEIRTLTGKWKLGQNREERDLIGAAGELDARGARQMADAMQQAWADRKSP